MTFVHYMSGVTIMVSGENFSTNSLGDLLYKSAQTVEELLDGYDWKSPEDYQSLLEDEDF